MDELFLILLLLVLGVVALIVGPVTFIMVLVINSRTKKRLKYLEDRLMGAERRLWEMMQKKDAAPPSTAAAEAAETGQEEPAAAQGRQASDSPALPAPAPQSPPEETPAGQDPAPAEPVPQRPAAAAAAAPAAKAVMPPRTRPPKKPPVKPAAPARPPMSEQKIMVILMGVVGGIAFLAAGLFFLKYAIDQGYLGPNARVLLGSLTGVVLLVLGEVLRGKHKNLGHILAGTGVGLIYIAMWAGERLYGIIPFEVALGVVAVVVALAGIQAVRFKSRLVAYMGLVGAYALLLLMGSESDFGSWGLLYVLALAVGTGEVVRKTRWADLLVVALLGSLSLELASFAESHNDPWVWAVLVMGIHLSLMARVRLWKESHPAPASILGGAIALSVALFAVGYIALDKTVLALPMAALLVVLIVALRFLVPDKFGVVHGLSLLGASFATSIFLLATLMDDKLFGFAGALGFSTVCLGVVIVAGLSGLWNKSERPAFGLVAMSLAAAAAWIELCGLHWLLYREYLSETGSALVPLIHGFAALVPLFRIKQVWGPMEPPLQGEQKSFLVQGALVLLFLTAVLPIQLDHEHLAVGLALEAVVLFLLAARWRAKELTVASLFCLSWSLLLLMSDMHVWEHPLEGEMMVLNWRLYAFGLPIGATLLITRLLRKESSWLGGVGETIRGPLRGITGVAGLVMTFIYLNLECMAWFREFGPIGPEVHKALPEMVRSMVWMGYGFMLLVWGIARFNKPIRYMALAILVLSVGKVFLFDIWSALDGLYRVFALLALAILLMLGAFLYSRVVANWDKRKEEKSFDEPFTEEP